MFAFPLSHYVSDVCLESSRFLTDLRGFSFPDASGGAPRCPAPARACCRPVSRGGEPRRRSLRAARTRAVASPWLYCRPRAAANLHSAVFGYSCVTGENSKI